MGELIVLLVLGGFVLTFVTMMTTRRMDRDEAARTPEENLAREIAYREKWTAIKGKRKRNDLRSPEQ